MDDYKTVTTEELNKEVLDTVLNVPGGQGTPFVINDATPDLVAKYLTPEASIFLSDAQKAVSQHVVDHPIGNCFSAVYFSVIVAEDNIELGIQKMAEIANDLVSRKLIHSILAPISTLALAKRPFQRNCVVVLFFPLVPTSACEEFTKHEYAQPEGGIGPILGSLSKSLPPGEFLAEVYISHFNPDGTTRTKEEINKYLQLQIDQFLKFLPKETQFIWAEKCDAFDASNPYELRFYCPLLPNVKRVELEWCRDIVMLDGKLHQFNLFTGIRFFGTDPVTKAENVELYR